MSDQQDQQLDNEMELTGNDLLTLVDEDGEEHQFEVADSAEYEGQDYLALIPVFDNPQELLDDSGELIILKVIEDGEDQYLEAIEDEAEFNKVGDFFMKRLEDVYDFED